MPPRRRVGPLLACGGGPGAVVRDRTIAHRSCQSGRSLARGHRGADRTGLPQPDHHCRGGGLPSAGTVFARIYLTDFEADYEGLNAVYHRHFANAGAMPETHHRGCVAKLGRGAKVEIDLVIAAR